MIDLRCLISGKSAPLRRLLILPQAWGWFSETLGDRSASWSGYSDFVLLVMTQQSNRGEGIR